MSAAETGGRNDHPFMMDAREARALAPVHFQLTDDLSAELIRLGLEAVTTVKVTSLDPKAVMVRLLLRSCEAVQAIILLAERGLPSTTRSLLRGLIEDGLCAAVLHDQPDVFIEMLKADFNESQRRKGEFILAQDLLTDPAAKDRLRATIDNLDKGKILSPKKVAELGPLLKYYLAYQWFSDESGHVTARSLNRYVSRNPDPTGWAYRWQPADAEEIETTLYYAAHAALAVGVAATQLVGDRAGNQRLGPLAERTTSLKPVKLG